MIAGVRTALRRGELSAVELTERALSRAAGSDAFVALTPELAFAQARVADEELRRGHVRGPLHGLPLAVKDVIDVAGVPTRLGSPGAGHRLPEEDAAVVRAAVRGGAVVIGKTATHELAFGMTTPSVGNPFDAERTAGGSSGGSAAAVGAGVCSVALGTDTNGSIRCPAALCGVVGLKPTFGRVSREGVAPLAWSQDTVGSLAATVADCAALHAALVGRLERHDGPLRVGVDRALCESADEPVADAVLAAVEALADLGVRVVEISLPRPALAGAASYVTIMSEAARAWGAHADETGPEVRAALRAGRGISADGYLRAAQVRTLVRRRLRDALFGLDAAVLPTVPVTAALRTDASVAVRGRTRPVEAAHAQLTALASLTGFPALSVPCGLDAAGLPIGLQLVGPPDGEAALLRVGEAVERLRGAKAVYEERTKR